MTWGKAMEFLMGPAAKNFMLAGDGPKNAASRKLMYNALYQGEPSKGITTGNEKWLVAVRNFYEETTISLLKDKSYALPGGNQVDLVRDVGNLAHVHFGAEMFSVPLKTQDFPRGIFTESQLYLINAAVFTCVFFDVDPPKSFPLRQQAYQATQMLGDVLQLQVAAIKATGKIAETLENAIRPTSRPLKYYGIHMITKLLEEDKSVSDVVWGNIMGALGGMVAPQGQLFGQIMNFYLGAGKEYWPKIQALAKEGTTAAEETLMKYVLEGIRLDGESGVMRVVQKEVTLKDENGIPGYPQERHLKPGDTIMVNLKAASRDPKGYENPNQVDLNRPLDSYIQLGDGAHQCLGLPMTRVALTTMLKVVAKLENVQPATMMIGKNPFVPSSVKKVVKEFVPGDLAVIPESWHYHAFLTEDWGMYFPFPQSEWYLWPLRRDVLLTCCYRYEGQLYGGRACDVCLAKGQ